MLPCVLIGSGRGFGGMIGERSIIGDGVLDTILKSFLYRYIEFAPQFIILTAFHSLCKLQFSKLVFAFRFGFDEFLAYRLKSPHDLTAHYGTGMAAA